MMSRSRKGEDLDISKAHLSVPIAKREVLMTFPHQRGGILVGHEGLPVHVPTHRRVVALDGKSVHLFGDDLAARASFAVFSMLVEARDDIKGVVPTAENEHISRLMVFPVAEDLHLDVADLGH